MPKVIKKRVKKQISTEEEDVKNIYNSAKLYAVEKRKTLTPIVIAAVIIIIAASGFSIYRSGMSNKAEALEYAAYKTYYSQNQKTAALNKTPEQSRKALEAFKKAYETRKTANSLFYLANCYYDLGQYDDALKSLKELNERFPDDERFVPLSYYKMAMVSLKKGDKETALKLFDTIYNYRTGSFKDLALLESAKVLEAMGKGEDAVKKYTELTKNFPASPFAAEALARQGAKKD